MSGVCMYPAGVTRDGEYIFFSKNKNKQLNKEVKKLISTALETFEYKKHPYIYQFSFDHIIGKTRLIGTSKNNDVTWGYLKNHKWRTPLVKGEPTDTNFLTLRFKEIEGHTFITDASFGKRTYLLPGSKDARELGPVYVKNAHVFWNRHALAVSAEQIDYARTIIKLKSENEEKLQMFLKTFGEKV